METETSVISGIKKSLKTIGKYCQESPKLLKNTPNCHELLDRIGLNKSRKHKIRVEKKSMSIVSLNIGGKIKDKLALGHPVRGHIEEQQPDIIFLFETLTKKSYNCPNIPYYRRIFKGADQLQTRGRPSGGICAYVSENLRKLTIIRSKNSQILAVGVMGNGERASRTWVIGIYVRPNPNPDYQKRFYENLHNLLTKITEKDAKRKCNTKMFFTGDFNTRLGNLTMDLDPNGKAILHKHSTFLLNFIQQNKLEIANITHGNLMKTYVGCSKRVVGSIVDYALYSPENPIEKFSILGGLDCDHRMLIFTTKCNLSYDKILPPPKYLLKNFDGCSHDLFEKYLRRTDHIMQRMYLWGDNCLQKSDNLATKRMVLEFITTTFYFCWEISLCLGIGYRSPRHWHTEEFSLKIADLHSELRNLRSQNRPESEIQNLKNRIKKAQKSWNYKKNNERMTKIEAEGLYSRTFNSLFRQKAHNGGITDTKLKEHFSNVFGEDFILDILATFLSL